MADLEGGTDTIVVGQGVRLSREALQQQNRVNGPPRGVTTAVNNFMDTVEIPDHGEVQRLMHSYTQKLSVESAIDRALQRSRRRSVQLHIKEMESLQTQLEKATRGSMYLTKRQFKQLDMIKELEREEPEAAQVLRSVVDDMAEGGKFHVQEYLAVVSCLLNGSLHEKLQWLFRVYDRGDNMMDKQDVTRLVTAFFMGRRFQFREELSSEQSAAFENQVVSLSNYSTYTKRAVTNWLHDLVDKIFNDMDHNHDGKISEAEFTRWGMEWIKLTTYGLQLVNSTMATILNPDDLGKLNYGVQTQAAESGAAFPRFSKRDIQEMHLGLVNNMDGRLTLDEFFMCLPKSVLESESEVRVLENMFNAFDTRQRGLVSARQLEIGLIMFVTNASVEEKVQLVFHVWDDGARGYIPRGEVYKLFEALDVVDTARVNRPPLKNYQLKFLLDKFMAEGREERGLDSVGGGGGGGDGEEQAERGLAGMWNRMGHTTQGGAGGSGGGGGVGKGGGGGGMVGVRVHDDADMSDFMSPFLEILTYEKFCYNAVQFLQARPALEAMVILFDKNYVLGSDYAQLSTPAVANGLNGSTQGSGHEDDGKGADEGAEEEEDELRGGGVTLAQRRKSRLTSEDGMAPMETGCWGHGQHSDSLSTRAICTLAVVTTLILFVITEWPAIVAPELMRELNLSGSGFTLFFLLHSFVALFLNPYLSYGILMLGSRLSGLRGVLVFALGMTITGAGFWARAMLGPVPAAAVMFAGRMVSGVCHVAMTGITSTLISEYALRRDTRLFQRWNGASVQLGLLVARAALPVVPLDVYFAVLVGLSLVNVLLVSIVWRYGHNTYQSELIGLQRNMRSLFQFRMRAVTNAELAAVKNLPLAFWGACGLAFTLATFWSFNSFSIVVITSMYGMDLHTANLVTMISFGVVLVLSPLVPRIPGPQWVVLFGGLLAPVPYLLMVLQVEGSPYVPFALMGITNTVLVVQLPGLLSRVVPDARLSSTSALVYPTFISFGFMAGILVQGLAYDSAGGIATTGLWYLVMAGVLCAVASLLVFALLMRMAKDEREGNGRRQSKGSMSKNGSYGHGSGPHDSRSVASSTRDASNGSVRSMRSQSPGEEVTDGGYTPRSLSHGSVRHMAPIGSLTLQTTRQNTSLPTIVAPGSRPRSTSGESGNVGNGPLPKGGFRLGTISERTEDDGMSTTTVMTFAEDSAEGSTLPVHTSGGGGGSGGGGEVVPGRSHSTRSRASRASKASSASSTRLPGLTELDIVGVGSGLAGGEGGLVDHDLMATIADDIRSQNDSETDSGEYTEVHEHFESIQRNGSSLLSLQSVGRTEVNPEEYDEEEGDSDDVSST